MGWIENNINKDISDYLFNIRLECLPNNIGVYQRDVRPDLNIDYDQLELQLVDIPAMLAFWDMLLAEQKNKRAKLEKKKEIIRGFITASMLKEADDNKVKMRREDIKDVICADDSIVEVESQILTELKKEEKIRVIVRAIQIKAENLRSLSGFKRIERSETK